MLVETLQHGYRKAALEFYNRVDRRRMRAKGFTNLFEEMPTSAGAQKWHQLHQLYRFIRQHKPKTLLEFGTGSSTIMISQALADNAAEGVPGHVHCVDADSYWGETTIEALPEQLNPYCTVTLSKQVAVDWQGQPAWQHDFVPDIDPDFIHLNGPDLTRERPVAVDILNIQSRMQIPAAVLVSGRSRNCAFLEKHFQRPFRRKYYALTRTTVYLFNR